MPNPGQATPSSDEHRRAFESVVAETAEVHAADLLQALLVAVNRALSKPGIKPCDVVQLTRVSLELHERLESRARRLSAPPLSWTKRTAP